MSDHMAAWDVNNLYDPPSYSAPVYGDDKHVAWWCYVTFHERLGLWRAQVKTYRDTLAVRQTVVCEAFRDSAGMAKAWCQNWIKRAQMNDDRLMGTEIPDDWTLNVGENLRPLEAGMEIRYRPEGHAYPILKVGPAGAVVRGPSRTVAVGGNSINSNGPPQQISLYSEVWYRRKRATPKGQWEGIDEHGAAVVDYELDAENQNEGEEVMAEKQKTKIAAAPAAGAPAKVAAKGNGAAAKPAAKVAKAPKEKVEKAQLPCICGCGKTTGAYFVPGHDARFKGWLGKIAKGEAQPKELMSPELVKALGPWSDKGEGKVPAKSYRDLRA